MSSWTIFGVGNFTLDIIDAITANHEHVSRIVLNQIISKELLKKIPEDIDITQLKSFKPTKTKNIFGFLDPSKESFLKALSAFNITYSNLIHPRAYLADGVILGQGNFIGAGSIVAPNVKLGNFNYVNRLASIGHDVTLKNLNIIGPGVTICGRCSIGNKNYFGAGSTVIDGLEIHDNILLGAGGLLLKNAFKSGTYIGVPAKLRPSR